MLDFSIYLMYRAGTAITSALPMRLLFRVGNVAGLVVWLVVPKYRRLAQRNLEVAFAGEKSRSDLRRICRRNFQRGAANLLCSVKMSSMPPEKIARHLEADDFEPIHRPLRDGKP